MFEKTLPYNPVTTFQIGFQDPASPVAEGISAFHNDLRVLVRFILRFVVFIMHYCLTTFSKDVPDTLTYKGGKDAYMAEVLQNKAANIDTKWGKTQYRITHGTILEILWTTIPALILVQIAIPSFSLLYSVDEIIEPLFNFKVVGHQWYWSYEFIDTSAIVAIYHDMNLDVDATSGFDSYLLSEEDRLANQGLTSLRNLTVDNHLFLPARRPRRAMVTSADVLHSWAVPSLGIKLDACPGRLNQTALFIKRKGIYYGQCSEICGVNHGFRPIGIACQDFAGFDSLVYSAFSDYEAFINAQE